MELPIILQILGIHLIGSFIAWLLSSIAIDDEASFLSNPLLPFWPFILVHWILYSVLYFWEWITDTSIHIHCPEDNPL